MASHNTGKAGVIVAPEDSGAVDKLTHAVIDDLLYNIVHDLLLKVHRDEKIAKANTAAIRVEKLASDASESSTPDSKPDVRVETDAAIYEDGKVLLKGNPLKTTNEIICPRCHLPRLLHPTEGKGARKPDPNVTYCKKMPYIQKPGFDIYGQTWVQQGPGRGKKKKDMEKTDTPEQRPPNMLSFPSATCSKCKRCILVTRLNNHMGSCIGNSGRNASRAAAQKISNGSSGAANGGSQDATPPNSQKGTPLPGSAAGSPKKRDNDDLDDDDDSENSHKKKKVKPVTPVLPAPTVTKKVILKTKGPLKKDGKAKPGSGLSVEQKVDGTTATSETNTDVAKKITKIPSPAKKLKIGTSTSVIKPPVPPVVSSKAGRDADVESESSGTLSSPPIV